VAALARAAYGVDPVVIPNGVDLQKAPASASRPGETIKFIFAGRMVLQKNLSWGLDRLAALRDRNWTFDLYGDGPCRADLEKQCLDLGLTERVKFHGWISPEDVDREMANADILFMPSLSEGLSLSAVNALAYGLAFACSRIGGFADIVVDGKNGMSAPPDDAQGFERGLANLLDDPERLFGMKQTSKQMAGSFERKLVAKSYETVFSNVLQHSEQAPAGAKAN
jgi:glycosyltransferase involved in cell wall biosynthesis